MHQGRAWRLRREGRSESACGGPNAELPGGLASRMVSNTRQLVVVFGQDGVFIGLSGRLTSPIVSNTRQQVTVFGQDDVSIRYSGCLTSRMVSNTRHLVTGSGQDDEFIGYPGCLTSRMVSNTRQPVKKSGQNGVVIGYPGCLTSRMVSNTRRPVKESAKDGVFIEYPGCLTSPIVSNSRPTVNVLGQDGGIVESPDVPTSRVLSNTGLPIQPLARHSSSTDRLRLVNVPLLRDAAEQGAALVLRRGLASNPLAQHLHGLRRAPNSACTNIGPRSAGTAFRPFGEVDSPVGADVGDARDVSGQPKPQFGSLNVIGHSAPDRNATRGRREA